VEAIGHPRVEGLVLVTPNGAHEAHTVPAAESARHVFVEPDAQALESVTEVLLGGEPVAFEPRDILAEFGACIRGEAQPETGAAEGNQALRVILDALGSPAWA